MNTLRVSVYRSMCLPPSTVSFPICRGKISRGLFGVLLTGVTEVGYPDVLNVDTVCPATVMANNISHFFWFAGRAYLYRYSEHNDSFLILCQRLLLAHWQQSTELDSQ
jgi:hypothetical protein